MKPCHQTRFAVGFAAAAGSAPGPQITTSPSTTLAFALILAALPRRRLPMTMCFPNGRSMAVPVQSLNSLPSMRMLPPENWLEAMPLAHCEIWQSSTGALPAAKTPADATLGMEHWRTVVPYLAEMLALSKELVLVVT